MWGEQCDPNFFLSWQTIHGSFNPSPFWMEYREGFCNDSLAAMLCFKWGGANPLIDATSVIQCDSSHISIIEAERSAWPTVLTVHGGELRIPYLSTGQTRYALYSLLGQQLMEGNLIGDALQLPYLPPGIYVLRISGTHRQTVFKLINP
jgi:hypothetical protein